MQGSFAYVLSICASPKGPIGSFTGPAKATCTSDATCPRCGRGSCDLPTPARAYVRPTVRPTNNAVSLVGCATPTIEGELRRRQGGADSGRQHHRFGANRVIQSVSLNAEFNNLYTTLALPDTSARRLPLSATDLAFLPGSLTAFIPAHGSDAVYRVAFNATYETKAVDSVGRKVCRSSIWPCPRSTSRSRASSRPASR